MFKQYGMDPVHESPEVRTRVRSTGYTLGWVGVEVRKKSYHFGVSCMDPGRVYPKGEL